MKKPMLDDSLLLQIHDNNELGLYEEKFLPTAVIDSMYHDIRLYQRQLTESQNSNTQIIKTADIIDERNQDLLKKLEWAARIIDSGMASGILRYDPREWFTDYHNMLQPLNPAEGHQSTE